MSEQWPSSDPNVAVAFPEAGTKAHPDDAATKAPTASSEQLLLGILLYQSVRAGDCDCTSERHL